MMNTNKNCIISLATKAGYYADRIARLSNSLRDNFDGDFLGFIHEHSVGAPLHSDAPYAFKIYAFERALQQGYTKILWLDTSVYAIANVKPIFDEIECAGHIAQESGYYLNQWCNDETLEYYGLTRDQASTIRMIGNAGFLGLDFTKESSRQFFQAWKQAMLDGKFNGSWDNHRHDMSCSSASWAGMGFNIQSGEKYLQYAGIFDKTLNDTIILKAQG